MNEGINILSIFARTFLRGRFTFPSMVLTVGLVFSAALFSPWQFAQAQAQAQFQAQIQPQPVAQAQTPAQTQAQAQAQAQEPSQISLSELKSKYGDLYLCPGDDRLATFSVKVSSQQITYTANALHVPIPAMGLLYLGRDGFKVEFDRDSLLKIENGSLVLDVAEAIRNAVEGFFQAYETLAFRNLLADLPATPTITISSDTTVVEYPDRTPGQAVKMSFDRDFRLLALEARDDLQHARNLMVPKWVQIGQKFMLVAVEIEFFQNGSSNFHTLFKIENQPVKGLFLPSRVTMHARDGGMESVKSALIDFQMNGYELGQTKP